MLFLTINILYCISFILFYDVRSWRGNFNYDLNDVLCFCVLPVISFFWCYFWGLYLINLLTPNVNYSGRTAQLTSKVAFYIFIQQI